MCRLFIRAGTD